MVSSIDPILATKPMPAGPMPTLDPFLFCVYHKDQYPYGNDKMEAPHVGNGHDFDPSLPYRMYHGSSVPGFPQHPHRGFETITATIDGIIDHADSIGNAGRYGKGDVQWMTAGKGVVHSEMFPLLQQQEENPTRFFQIWLNLPSQRKFVEPSFAMFWNTEVPVFTKDKVSITLWAGHNYFDIKTNPNSPPGDSWAADPDHDVAIWHICLQPGANLVLPTAHGKKVNRSLFFVEGSQDGTCKVAGTPLKSRLVLDVDSSQEIQLELDESAQEQAEFLLLQGQPIDEPVAQHGPFVMNTRSEIQQAFMDYQRTQFGGWPWDRDDMIFERSKGRFAKLNGKETYPPAEGVCKE